MRVNCRRTASCSTKMRMNYSDSFETVSCSYLKILRSPWFMMVTWRCWEPVGKTAELPRNNVFLPFHTNLCKCVPEISEIIIDFYNIINCRKMENGIELCSELTSGFAYVSVLRACITSRCRLSSSSHHARTTMAGIGNASNEWIIIDKN